MLEGGGDGGVVRDVELGVGGGVDLVVAREQFAQVRPELPAGAGDERVPAVHRTEPKRSMRGLSSCSSSSQRML